jgi:hypothetical protein
MAIALTFYLYKRSSLNIKESPQNHHESFMQLERGAHLLFFSGGGERGQTTSASVEHCVEIAAQQHFGGDPLLKSSSGPFCSRKDQLRISQNSFCI